MTINNIQIDFCAKVNKEYFSERQRLCNEIVDVCPVLSPMVISQKNEVTILEISKQVAAIDNIRTALINACQRNKLTVNQMNHLIAVENLINKINQKLDVNVDAEVTEAAKQVEDEEEASRKTKTQERGERSVFR